MVENLNLDTDMIIDVLGRNLGALTKSIVSRTGTRRVVLAGGDISGRITQELNILAFQVARSIGVAAPLSYAYSSLPEIHGLQVASKGGMVGEDNYFDEARKVRVPDFKEVSLGNVYIGH